MAPSRVTLSSPQDALPAKLALLDQLPELSATYHKLIEGLFDDNIDRKRLATLINQSPSLSGKLVGLANSAYFGITSQVNNVDNAIFVIGFQTVKSLAIATALQQPFNNLRCPSFHPANYWLHVSLTAQLARQLAKQSQSKLALDESEVYLAGLLHNIGLLAMAEIFPDELNSILQHDLADDALLTSELSLVFGVDHHTIAAAILKHWCLPDSIVATARNINDRSYRGPYSDLSRIVGIASNWATNYLSQQQHTVIDDTDLSFLGIDATQANTITHECLAKIDELKELAELISDSKLDNDNRKNISQATITLRHRLGETISSLSSISALANLDCHNQEESLFLRRALEILIHNKDIERCSIFLNNKQQFVNVSGISWAEYYIYNRKHPDKNLGRNPFQDGEGIIGLVAQNNEVIHSHDCMSDPRFKSFTDTTRNISGSLISVPIHSNNEVLGVLNISHSQKNIFNEWHERFIKTFSEILAQKIIYSRTLHAMSDEIKHRQRVEASLLQAKETAERANRAKDTFLSSMSHELRTPLNAILGFSQLMEMDVETPLTDQQADQVQEISRAGRHLLQLINGVLDLSRIEAGQLNLQPEPVILRDIINECIVQVNIALATEKGISVNSDVDDPSLVFIADKVRLRQILLNLLSNAVKYNRDEGTVSVTSSYDEKCRLCLNITDTGVGIAEQDIEKLYKPFERLDYNHGQVEGTGIGLTVTRQLVRSMGGEIGVESIKDQGSRFWFTLPTA